MAGGLALATDLATPFTPPLTDVPGVEPPAGSSHIAPRVPSSPGESEEVMAETNGERHAFQAEVSKLLGLMANSLYRDKEIFLRELISNASDACDKLRYAAITQPDLLGDDAALAVTITPDSKSGVLVVADNGIGMNREELIDNLGTIARSGTEAFVKQMAESHGGDGQDEQDGQDGFAAGLIGQFGVGFYSCFMVAKRVEVVTRKPDEAEGWRWRSDGTGSFSIAPEADAARGTRIELHLRKDDREFLEPLRIRTVVKAYSDHIGLPIWLENDSGQKEMVNEGSALWSRPKTDIDEAQYREFYHHIAHMPGDPWHTIHLHAEGRIEYTALLFVPDSRPFDLFEPIRQHRVRLYVRRVFITDECEGLIPPYLRFVRGVVDSSDLALNVSRETLQNDPILAKIRTGLEGLYEDAEQKDRLLPLVRFRSTGGGDRWLSLDEYVDSMPEEQEAIYYISGEDPDALRRSPQVEGFRARGIDVLLMADPVDQFWLPVVGAYKEKSFRSVTQGAADLDRFAVRDEDKPDETDAPPPGEIDKLIALVKLTLADAVKDVRTSERLTDSPVCLVADEGDLDMHLERLLRQHKHEVPAQKRVLEINPSHDLTRALARMVGQKGATEALEDAAHLLMDQALILEGEPVPDPSAFTKRLSGLISRALTE
ncbi:Chaperone protein HtpG [Geodia barretti]|uniref:Chaperone protein HtpG n=1 Tax=Geodia barretti TaxID=519541 RepID=A0AA35TH55_GEOBA|nr:Chaperone protein HtpG [Geodia barretti]